MGQAGSTGSACTHSPYSQATQIHAQGHETGQTHPASCGAGDRPSVPRNSFLCTHTITHTYSCSHTLNIPGFSQSQTCTPLLHASLAAQTHLPAAPLPAVRSCAHSSVQCLLQYSLLHPPEPQGSSRRGGWGSQDGQRENQGPQLLRVLGLKPSFSCTAAMVCPGSGGTDRGQTPGVGVG